MKSLEEKIKEAIPTLVVFQHSGNQNADNVDYLIEEIRAKYNGRASVVSVDASHNGKYKVHFKLSGYPTWILYKEGQELMRESGNKTLAELTDMVDRAL